MPLSSDKGDIMDFKKNYDTLSAAEKGFTYILKDFDGIEQDASVDVLGVGSRIHKQAQQKIDNQVAIFDKRGKKMDEDQSNELYIEMLAKCTKGWKNIEEDGKAVEFSFDNAVRMYTDYPFLRNQILAAVHDVKAMLEGNS